MKEQFVLRGVNRAVKAALFSSILVTPQVFAADDAEKEEADSASAIEHIEVTSRHRSESIDKIPVSVVSFDMEEMAKAGMQNMNDIAAGAIGFSMEKTFGRQADIPVIRGVSWIPGYGTQKASYFIDGIYFDGSIQSLPMDLIQRVEVIKGPQSALYGRRTFSGAINIVTRKPTDELSGYVNATFGSYGNQQFSAGASMAVTDTLSIRGSVSADSYDGNWENTLEGGPGVGGETSNSQMLGIYFRPSADTRLDINFVRNETDDEHSPFMMLSEDADPRTPPSVFNCHQDTVPYYCGEVPTDIPIRLGGMLDNGEYGLRGERTHLSVNLSHTFDFGTLSYMAGFNSYETENGVDQTYIGAQRVFDFKFFQTRNPADMFGTSAAWHTLANDDNSEYSHEVRFESSALDDRLMWSVGAYVWHSEKNTTDRNKYNTVEDNTAIMGMVSYDVNDDLNVSFELRNSTDKIESQAYVDLIKDPKFADLDNEFNSTTTRFIAEYNLDSDTLIYATRAEGNSPAGFNNESGLPTELVVIEEEEMLMYEAGIKSTLLDDTLYVSAAIYNMDWDNQQLTDTYLADNATPNSYTSNAGKTDVTGFELQGKYVINDAFNLDFGYSVTSAEFVELFDSNHCKIVLGPGFGPAKNCVTPEEIREHGDLSGNTPPQVPETEISLALNYKQALADNLDLFARTDVNYDSSRFAHVHNLAETGDRTLVNLNVGVETENWSVSAWVKNALDDDTPTYIFRYIDTQSFAFSSRAFPIAPSRGREMGVTASYRF